MRVHGGDAIGILTEILCYGPRVWNLRLPQGDLRHTSRALGRHIGAVCRPTTVSGLLDADIHDRPIPDRDVRGLYAHNDTALTAFCISIDADELNLVPHGEGGNDSGHRLLGDDFNGQFFRVRFHVLAPLGQASSRSAKPQWHVPDRELKGFD
ncbi:MAG: hypothetical protein ACI89X_003526 [Planctomycetota bacterium]